ncbi:MAG: T9SS type A sorting domain-containing protein, partial [Bacteroidia bacterium]|nr:T9SS type A sorting domain-containing protein [Bacteroidia bacterium]
NAPVDTVCVGATTAISVVSSVGNIQWQINDGTGWVDATGLSSDSSVYTFMPTGDADYRAVAFSGGCPNDTSNSVAIAVLQITDPTAFDTVRCGPGPVNMHATGIGQQVWYDEPVGGTKLGTGNIFTITIQDTDTFYVESNVGTLCNVGEEDNTIGNTSTFTSTTANWGLQFNTQQPIYLDRVHVYVGNTAGNITVNLRDAIGGNLLHTGTFFVPANVAKHPLDLGWFVSNGTGFALELQANPTVDLIYNFTGSGYPLSAPGCPVTITGYFNPNLNTFDDYLYFYDWEISDGCKTNRFPAIATVLPLPPKPSVMQNANTLSAVDPALSYQWYLNGLPIAGATSQTYVVTQLGDYQVEIGSANGCTEISNIYTITIISPPGIDEGAEEIDLQIFPNPTADVFNIAFELEETANVKITLRNALSQDLILLNEEKIRGKYENQFDATNYTDGIYLLEIEVDDVSFNRKLIIAR